MIRILFFAAATAAVSCVQIDGGAVEASWVVRSDDGRAITECRCSNPQIANLRFRLTGVSEAVKGTDPCKGRAACTFSCQRHSGTTPFDIPPGSYLISLVPLDAAGQDLGMATAERRAVGTPAPVLRDVVTGQPTQLDALAVVAGCAPTCSVNTNRVCSD